MHSQNSGERCDGNPPRVAEGERTAATKRIQRLAPPGSRPLDGTWLLAAARERTRI